MKNIYVVVGSTDIQKFEEIIANADADGYKPVGGMGVDSEYVEPTDQIKVYYHLLMVKEES